MANHMKEVANMLGVEMGERFEVLNPMGEPYLNKFYFTEEGVAIDGSNTYADRGVLSSLICGTYTIRHIPWKPSRYEAYYYVETDGCIVHNEWARDTIDLNYYKLGNCYPTPQEAEANKDKWVTFYSSDEILEV